MSALEIRHSNYDTEFDVLRILFPLPDNMFSYDEELSPGIILSRSETDERISGVTVLDFSERTVRELQVLVPIVDWKSFKLLN